MSVEGEVPYVFGPLPYFLAQQWVDERGGICGEGIGLISFPFLRIDCISYFSVSVIKYHDQKQLAEEFIFRSQFQSPSLQGSTTASREHGSWRRKQRVHIVTHKCEASKESQVEMTHILISMSAPNNVLHLLKLHRPNLSERYHQGGNKQSILGHRGDSFKHYWHLLIAQSTLEGSDISTNQKRETSSYNRTKMCNGQKHSENYLRYSHASPETTKTRTIKLLQNGLTI